MLKQKYFYPLLTKFDREFLASLKKAVDGKFEFLGSEDDKVFFVKSLLVFQMLKDYRAPLRAVKNNLTKKTSLSKINQELKKKDFKIDYSWAVWGHEKIMGRLAEKLFKSSPKIIGNDNEFNEFVLRYLVSIWLADWEGPLYALLQSTKEGEVNLSELNEILSLWDFTNIFALYKQA